jgi:hypothetical protein
MGLEECNGIMKKVNKRELSFRDTSGSGNDEISRRFV